jgi:hypothetical protein
MSLCQGSWNWWRCLFIPRRNEQIPSYNCSAQNRRSVFFFAFIHPDVEYINQLRGWFRTSYLGIDTKPISKYLYCLVQSLTCTFINLFLVHETQHAHRHRQHFRSDVLVTFHPPMIFSPKVFFPITSCLFSHLNSRIIPNFWHQPSTITFVYWRLDCMKKSVLEHLIHPLGIWYEPPNLRLGYMFRLAPAWVWETMFALLGHSSRHLKTQNPRMNPRSWDLTITNLRRTTYHMPNYAMIWRQEFTLWHRRSSK